MSSAPPQPRVPTRAQLTVAILVLCLIWGSSWLVIQDGLDTLPPLFSAGLRFIVAGLVMSAVAARLREREGGRAPPTWLWVLVATTNFALSYGVIYWVQQLLPSGLVSVLWAIYPIMMAASGHVFLPGERLRGPQWIGFLLGFLGVVFLFENDLATLESGRAAALLLLLSPVASAFGTTMLKRHGAATSSLVLNRNAMLLGGAFLLALSAALSEPLPVTVLPGAVLGLLYLAVFGTVAAFGLYYWVLRYVAASRLSLVAYVTPAIALFLGWAVAGEAIYPSTLLGAGLIAGGIAIASHGRHRTRLETESRAEDPNEQR